MALTAAELIALGRDKRASDIHLLYGRTPMCRVDGQIRKLADYELNAEVCEAYARELTGTRCDELLETGEVDLSATISGIRVRINAYKQQKRYSAAIRLLSDTIPELSALGLPQIVSDFPKYPRGIVLVTGETGSGKSTTLAALLNSINHTRYEHILTLEDPIEYIYEPDKCIVNQREIGRDTKTYASGLRAALREDPDVILIGEMRDLETIEIALTAAETGHLVFATLHTGSAAGSVDRIVNVFPGERQVQIRMQLSMTLRAVLSQQLLPKYGGKGRVCACEVMIVNSAIRNLIREGKTPQINNAIATSAAEGSVTMDNMLIRMVREHKIEVSDALTAANDPDLIKRNTQVY